MEFKFNTSSHPQGFTISFIDTSKHKIALSEVSYLSKELVLEGLSDYEIPDDIIQKINNETLNHKHFAFYSRLNVPKEMQGKGLGAALLKETLSFCEQNEVFLLNIVNAYGTLNTKELIQFYKKNGMTLLDKEGLFVFYSPTSLESINTVSSKPKSNHP